MGFVPVTTDTLPAAGHNRPESDSPRPSPCPPQNYYHLTTAIRQAFSPAPGGPDSGAYKPAGPETPSRVAQTGPRTDAARADPPFRVLRADAAPKPFSTPTVRKALTVATRHPLMGT